MFEHFDTPEELFSFKLGSTLTAERDGVTMLQELAQAAQHRELQQLLTRHADETRDQAERIEQVFRSLGEQEQTAPAPTAKGLAKEAQATIRKTDSSIADASVLAAALENEHWEIANYEVLVENAHARGADEAARLLQQVLDQEVAMSKALFALLQRYSREGWAVSGATGGDDGRRVDASDAARAGA